MVFGSGTIWLLHVYGDGSMFAKRLLRGVGDDERRAPVCPAHRDVGIVDERGQERDHLVAIGVTESFKEDILVIFTLSGPGEPADRRVTVFVNHQRAGRAEDLGPDVVAEPGPAAVLARGDGTGREP